MSAKKTLEQFLIDSEIKYGKKFDYSKVIYKGNKEKVIITCPEHGEFSVSPNRFLHIKSKHGCPKCGRASAGEQHKTINKKSKDKVLSQFKDIHGDYYDYSNVNYIGTCDEVEIICPKHGIFMQQPRIHLMGSGCPKCFRDRKKISEAVPYEEFLRRARDKFGEMFEYDKSSYINLGSNIKIFCKKENHGWFETKASRHIADYDYITNISGCCPTCYKEYQLFSGFTAPKPLEEIIYKAKQVYGKDYNTTYRLVEQSYKSARDSAKFICDIHGEIEQLIYVYLRGNGCPKCVNEYKDGSKGEKMIASYIEKLGFKVERNNRKLLNGKEIDILVKEIGLGVEFCGLYWHGEVKSTNPITRHLIKLNKCKENGINLITLFDDEWNNSRKAVRALIRKRLKKSTQTVKASDLTISEIQFSKANKFLRDYDIKDVLDKDKYNIFGLYRNQMLLSVLVLEVYNNTSKIVRYCVKEDLEILGGLKKLVEFARLKIKTSIEYSIDLRYEDSREALANGFELVEYTDPGFYLFRGFTRLKTRYTEMSEDIQRLKDENNYDRIFDCGQILFRYGAPPIP